MTRAIPDKKKIISGEKDDSIIITAYWYKIELSTEYNQDLSMWIIKIKKSAKKESSK